MLVNRIFKTLLNQPIVNNIRYTQVCFHRFMNQPKLRIPEWRFKVERKIKDDNLTSENQKFIKEIVERDFGKQIVHKGVETFESKSLLKMPQIEPTQWKKGVFRCGVIAKKLGHYPLWKKDGTRICTTVLQVVDNHVIKYIPPGEFDPKERRHLKKYDKQGCLLVGAESVDPNTLTANYIGLFKGSGVMPTKHIFRFVIDPASALPPGTPLNVTHFRVGDFVDVRGKTIDRGFQGVVKRWGFKGGPATHGVTKTHRRPGSLASGKKSKIWKGKKMPGHMGNRWRVLRGLKIWRINTKTNTMWVSGYSVSGNPGDLVYIYDTVLPLRQPKEPLPMPTFLGDETELPEDIYEDSIHKFNEPTITYEPEK